MSAGQVIVCDLQRTMDNDTTDFQNLSVLVPRPLLASQLEQPDAVHGLIVDGTTLLGQTLRDHMTALAETADGLTAGDVQEVAAATVSLIAACVNGIGRAAQGKPVESPAPLLARIKRYILENLHDASLTPETIADRQGVPRRMLYEMFEPEGGVLTYLRVMGLKAAFDALRDPHQVWRSVDDIALEAGYGSERTFSRAFESMFDVTPGEVRRAAELATQSFAPQPGVDRRYEEWLRSLGPSAATRRASADAVAGVRR